MRRFGFALLGFAALAPLAWLSFAVAPRPVAAQAAIQQNIADFAFEPVDVTVPVGGAVVWTNVGPTIHTVASTDMAWSSEILAVGATYSHTFDAPGTYEIWCTIHPEMVGHVVVQ
jgi:plastocyanin